MRIGCLQFAPQVGDLDNNLNRADAVLSKANPQDLDLLVLPELAFTGYNFKSLRDISPFLEPQGSGITALWARTVALKLNCLVTVGYPEKVDVKPKWPTSPEYYNSVIVVNSDGETIANYRKTHLYYTDETWALEGPDGFYSGFIPGLGNTAMGICMDLNPKKFEASWNAYEFAFHCLDKKANLIIMTMAWNTREDARMFSRMPNEPDIETLAYWISRIEPLINKQGEEETIVIFCNRCGIEDDAVYAGTSTVLGIKRGVVDVYGILGRGEKQLLVVDTEKPAPKYLKYRPDDPVSPAASVPDSIYSSNEIGPINTDQTATTTLAPARPSPGSNSQEKSEYNAAQYQEMLEEARLNSQPHSPVSQASSSSHYSQSSNLSRSSRTSRSGKKETPSLGTREEHYGVPQGLTGVGSDRSLDAMNGSGSVPIRAPAAPRWSKSSTRSGASKDAVVHRGRSLQSEPKPARREGPQVPPIEIPQVPIEADAIPTPTGPSPTPLAIRPKLVIPQDAHKRHPKPYVPSPYPSNEPGLRASGVRSGRASSRQQNEIATPTTAFEDMTPQSPHRFFWVPSDALLKTPLEPRISTPPLADSPTLSTNVPPTSQVYARTADEAETQQIDLQSIRQRLGPATQPEGIRKLRTPRRSLPQVTDPQPSSKQVVDRSDSPFANRPDWAAIAKRLEALSPHPDLVDANKSTSFSPRPGSRLGRRIGTAGNSSDAALARPSSPKSRNASLSRASNPIDADDPLDGRRSENMSRASMRISVRASKLDDRPTRDRAQGYEEVGTGRHKPRAQSRGRPGAPYVSNEARRERSGSTRVGRRENSIPRRRPSAPNFYFRSLSEFEEALDRTEYENEIIGEIIVRRSSNCRVHGQSQATELDVSELVDPQGGASDLLESTTFETIGVVTSEETRALKTSDSLEACVQSPVCEAKRRTISDISAFESLLIPRSFSAPHSLPLNNIAVLSGEYDSLSTPPLTAPLLGSS
ncbi:hypothetical protein GGR51DRAFT_544488 [Nemania sp. FL0031]|nr:hypothetical protein GGR51DRAFT_544488 [Nemania sp. FL0031]